MMHGVSASPARHLTPTGSLSRRAFIQRTLALTGGLTLGGSLLAACAPVSPPTTVPAAPGTAQAPAQPAQTAATTSQAQAASAPAPKPASAAASEPQGKIAIAQGPEVVSLDSTIETGVLTFNVAHLIMEPLVRRNAKMQYEPLLATSWSFPDNKTIRFKIRQGVKFHNGDPLTAEDVAYTVQRVLDPKLKSKHSFYVEQIAGAKVVDPETVDVQLKQPDATLIGRFSLIGIVPKKVIESKGEEAWSASPLGTGPYKLVEWVKGQRIVLEANPDYWGEKPKIKQVVYRSIPEDSTRMTELRTGAVDIAVNVPPVVAKELKAAPGNVRLAQVRSLRNVFVVINTKKKPFDDVRVRQALNYAIDRQLIIDTVLDGYGFPVNQPYGPGVFGFNPNIKDYGYDPEKAKSLLTAAGYQNGFKANLISAVGRYLNDREVVLAIAGQLEQIGVKVEPKFMEFEQMMDAYARTYNPDQDLRLFSNANNTADADYNLSLNFHSGNRGLYWKNEEVDRLIDQARGEFDTAKREAIYHDLTAKLVADAPVIFLYDQMDVYGVSQRVQGWTPRPDEIIDLSGVSVSN